MTALGKLGVTCSLSLSAAFAAYGQTNQTPIASPAGVASQSAGDANSSGVVSVQKDDASTPASKDNEYSQYRFNSAIGNTGTLHLLSADSGAPGTFRLAYLMSYYAGDGFLCPTSAHCTPPPGIRDTQDAVRRNSSALTLTITPTSYLELALGVHSHAVSDNFSSPSVIQAFGDTYGGLKLFTPRKPDQIFSIGWLGQLRLLNSAGRIGVTTANVLLGGLATADFSNRSNPKRRVPVRLHANLGYLFDNSASIASDVEKARARPITRIERFGFGINRVDSVLMGLGLEYVGRYLQPFTEWTIDIASNRQSYVCQARTVSKGDTCLDYDTSISTTPSRWTIGTHVTPHWRGLSATLAFDIATSGSTTFVEERSPELPWNLFLGIGYAVDAAPAPVAQPVAPVRELVQLPPPPEHHLLGTVVDEESGKPIAYARILFDGQERTGLVTKSDGSFDSGNLEPGVYKLNIKAEGYKEGTCSGTVEPEPQAAGQAPAVSVKNTELKCSLRPAPALGTIQGTLIDAETGAPLPHATLRVRDDRNRTLELQTDDAGNFRVENVPVGLAHVTIAAEGYLPSDTQVDVKKQVEQHVSLVVRKTPKKLSVTVTAKEVKLTKQVLFAGSSAVISSESQPIIQELAAVLQQHPELTSVEIQGHTDDVGSPAFNKRLSLERAESVRAALIALGVDGNRLTVTGFGSEKPLVPNTTDANRAKNRRVQLVILSKGELKP